MDFKKIKEGLKEWNENDVQNYLAYIYGLSTEKDRKTGQLKNTWMQNKTEEHLIRIFIKVSQEGLVFDGVNITLQSTGVSYNYQAYKNKMLIAYPESIIDTSLVYKEDEFFFSKDSGSVTYHHKLNNPFNQTQDNITGAYCVIKNKRGEFLTLLSKSDIDKHRKVAKTDYIWKQWFNEMALKTILKKACKQHFNDIYSEIELQDNENYDLEKLADFISTDQVIEINDLLAETKANKELFLKALKAKSVEEILPSQYGVALSMLKGVKK